MGMKQLFMPCRFRRHHSKLHEIGIGLALYESFNFLYDWLFYPFALAYWGLALGGTIVVLGSLLVCVVLFWYYDCLKIDWLGAHALRELDAEVNKNRFEKIATWIGKDKKTHWERLLSPVVFVFLTLPVDPLIVAIHYRKQHFGGVTRRDWGILLAAVLAANAWWLIKIEIVIEAVKWMLHLIGG